MKSIIISVGILIISISFTVVGTKLIDASLESIEVILAKECDGNTQEAVQYAKKLGDAYEKIKPHLCLMVDDDEIRELEACIYDIKSAANNHSSDEFSIAKSRLTSHIKQLRRLYTLSIEAIF